jgi:hypothetical protein
MFHPIPPAPPENPRPAVAQPSGPDERELLARLRALHEAGRVTVTVNRAKLTHMDFPLGLEADGNIWVYGMVPVIIAIWWFLGIYAGIGSGVVGYLIYRTLGHRYIERRLLARIHDKGLGEIDNWRKLWRFGGVILTDAATGETCLGPEGRWMGFVQAVDAKS